jgi:Tol biopolymer transport system component
MDGSEERKIFESDDPDIRIDYPEWSPDGEWVVFDRVEPQGADLWLLEGLR